GLLQVLEDVQQLVEVLATANVGDDRGALHAAAGMAEQLAERVDHPRRQVVDAEVAAVLEGGDRLRLAGAGVPGDHDDPDVLGRRDTVSWLLAGVLHLARAVELLVDLPRDLTRQAG